MKEYGLYEYSNADWILIKRAILDFQNMEPEHMVPDQKL